MIDENGKSLSRMLLVFDSCSLIRVNLLFNSTYLQEEEISMLLAKKQKKMKKAMFLVES